MTREDQIFTAMLRDKLKQCESRDIPTHTGFLTPAEVNLAERFCISEKARFVLDGGHEDAERRVCVFLPEWMDQSDDMLSVLHVTAPKQGRMLTHRDYMGAVLGLGVQRSVVGDILVREDGADIVILKEMSGFFELNFTSVGRASVSVSVCGTDVLSNPEQNTETLRDTVASLRLDSICASAFKLAR